MIYMYGIIIDYIAKGDYYKVKCDDGIYLAFQKRSKSSFSLGDTVIFEKAIIPLHHKMIKTAINLIKY